MEDDKNFIVSRLDGYLDALSLISGQFRSCLYFAYIVGIEVQLNDENINKIYEIESKVTFGRIQTIEPWLERLQTELEEILIPNPMGKALDKKTDGARAFQAAWYVIEMIRIITDDFKCKAIYKCTTDVINESVATGILYVFPISEGYLVVNLQWQKNV